ncbi:MAG: hypothetical protein KDI06_21825 [Calditrichaeota bacterium]|nr:hypothetical protein [Calditrichota bacterium]
MAGKKSEELLTHFNCEKCRKWWSIGDAPRDRESWYCPWCGHYQEVEEEGKGREGERAEGREGE